MSKIAPLFTSLSLICLLLSGCSDGPKPELGGLGESCRARNDCGEGLVCVREQCIPGSLGLSPTGKDCYRVECAETADCCGAFVPDPNCDVYESACTADPTQCLSYNSLCVCNETCDAKRCVDRGPGCASDDHCAFAAEPFCVDARCVACREHKDCTGSGERCVDGACTVGCTADAECPLFFACDGGACAPSGCESDRECVYYFSDSRGRCDEGTCAIACTQDYECDLDRGETCQEGRCAFAGCESDAECRVVLGLANEPPGVEAVCK